MLRKIREWVKVRRERKKARIEQKIAAEIIEQVERALSIKLYDWQRIYIITGIWQPPEGRRQGRTLAYILRMLLDQSKPLLMYELADARTLADNPFTGKEYEKVPKVYADWFRHETRTIYERLRAAGVTVREAIFTQQNRWRY